MTGVHDTVHGHMHEAVHGLVMARAPEPGRTKTRLAATVGPTRAAELSAAAMLDTLQACRAVFGPGHRHVSLAGSLDAVVDADCIRAALDGWEVWQQEGDDFADRLIRAHHQVPGPVVQVGTDTPQVTADDLQRVVELLAAADAVLGPAVDGGWWVLALHDSSEAACLRDVPMSSPETGAETLRSLRAAGLDVVLAPQMRDVDVVADAEFVARLAPTTEFARRWRMAASRA